MIIFQENMVKMKPVHILPFEERKSILECKENDEDKNEDEEDEVESEQEEDNHYENDEETED